MKLFELNESKENIKIFNTIKLIVYSNILKFYSNR